MAQPAAQPSLFDQFARGWRGYLLVALIALMSSLFGAGQVPVMDDAESRFAQATRQMLETGDYVRIRVQDEERNVKPVGVHWLQAASVTLFEPVTGKLNAIWPYRLPSALGIALAAIATLWGGAVLAGKRAALFGAALLAAGVLAGLEGMTAKTDAVLLGFTTLAMAALARLRTLPDERRILGSKELSMLFWAAIGCGVLVKGPVTPLVAALTLGALAIWERRARWMKPLLFWPGPLLALLIVAPWSIAITFETQGRFFAEMFGGDIAPKLMSGQEGQFALPGFHTFLLPFLIFPATYALPAAGRVALEAVRAPRASDAHASIRFLLAWAVPTILFFEIAPTKLPHYVLPAYPPITLLCGCGLAAMRGFRWRTAHPAGVVLFAVTGVVLVTLISMSATFMPGDFAADIRRAISTALIGIGIVAAGFTALIMLRRPAARVAAMVLCALALSFSLRERLLPEARTLFVSNEAVAALTRARLTPRDDRPLWVVGYDETSLVFLTRTSIRLAMPAQAAAGANAGDAMIVEGRQLETVSEALAARELSFTPAEPPVQGVAAGGGERVRLFVGEVTELDAVSEAADGRPRNP
ncbi:MAG TPA: glycosyltransferase family 39 protein [Vitreimonas sp.]|uniref:ArnT family glycosyltransferase n=1 Tax=Vitreimonas sp. TaxID=3069702 RepID=UPI002D34E017|nr:glycosyltransferase family 39 protein [Vitreimonas sp.]HYD86994.1 glycosyltransferase family 39 protein [Vitreimonas sp.]